MDDIALGTDDYQYKFSEILHKDTITSIPIKTIFNEYNNIEQKLISLINQIEQIQKTSTTYS
jgi:hypothetical protein